MSGRAIILMGSKSDLEHVQQISKQLDAFGIPSEMRIASAHKSVQHLLQVLEDYNASSEPIVFVAVAGRSNALAGMLDANTIFPVITCPPVSSSFGGADIFSSLRMPGGVAPAVILDPKGAALAVAKILALGDAALREQVGAFQASNTADIVAADEELQE